MDRRTFIKQTGVAAGAMALGQHALGGERSAKGGRPNILFIMTDQQHARMLSCAGNKWLKTPALDGLAADGIRFERAYSSNPVCVPSRTSMATGVMSCRLGATSNKDGMRAKLPANVNANSMGKIMKRAGYTTFYGGKVHMCSSLKPEQAGYDEYFENERGLLPGACLKFIKKKRKEPFFAVASFINPHDICFAHKARSGSDKAGVLKLYRKASSLPGAQLPPLPDNYAIPAGEPAAVEAGLSTKASTPTKTMRKTYTDKDWRINRWIYHRLTEKVDREIGELLEGLKKAGLEENTLIIFTSDHGNMDASHRLASKSFFYEESVGVPFIMKHKGQIPRGITDKSHLVSAGLDILPTLCDYAGVEKPAHLLGTSLRPIAEGKKPKNWRSYVASENGRFRMIRSERYKYCALDGKEREEFLVDLTSDPGELKNLAGNSKHRGVLREHRKLLAEWSKVSKDTHSAKFVRA